jgi:hypothetical protein
MRRVCPWRCRPLVAARVTYTGTHQGEVVGIPPTGKKTTSGVDFFRMQDDRQAEHWGAPDMFSFLMQLGVLPGPGTPGPGTAASSWVAPAVRRRRRSLAVVQSRPAHHA